VDEETKRTEQGSKGCERRQWKGSVGWSKGGVKVKEVRGGIKRDCN